MFKDTPFSTSSSSNYQQFTPDYLLDPDLLDSALYLENQGFIQSYLDFDLLDLHSSPVSHAHGTIYQDDPNLAKDPKDRIAVTLDGLTATFREHTENNKQQRHFDKDIDTTGGISTTISKQGKRDYQKFSTKFDGIELADRYEYTKSNQSGTFHLFKLNNELAYKHPEKLPNLMDKLFTRATIHNHHFSSWQRIDIAFDGVGVKEWYKKYIYPIFKAHTLNTGRAFHNKPLKESPYYFPKGVSIQAHSQTKQHNPKIGELTGILITPNNRQGKPSKNPKVKFCIYPKHDHDLKDKPYIKDKWNREGIEPSTDVWRLEVRFLNNYAIKKPIVFDHQRANDPEYLKEIALPDIQKYLEIRKSKVNKFNPDKPIFPPIEQPVKLF